jgi:3,4-dihydroxy 2-butanone 4-phosphate synthase/GTP cyclohydrolase II
VTDDVLKATDARLSAKSATDRPFITLSYAQSLDGSIALQDGRPLALSSPPSLFRTHALRARHDGVLVGVGTILADDPQLTVRHAAGPNPQPIVLDTGLRTPLPARILSNPRRPWFMAGAPVSPSRRTALVGAGALVLEMPRTPENLIDLPAALLPDCPARRLGRHHPGPGLCRRQAGPDGSRRRAARSPLAGLGSIRARLDLVG